VEKTFEQTFGTTNAAIRQSKITKTLLTIEIEQNREYKLENTNAREY